MECTPSLLGATEQEAIDSSVFDDLVIAVQRQIYAQWKDTLVTSFKDRWSPYFSFWTDSFNFYGKKLDIVDRILKGLIAVLVDKKMVMPSTKAGMNGILLAVMSKAKLTSKDIGLVSDVLHSALLVRSEVSAAILEPHEMTAEQGRSQVEKFWNKHKWELLLGLGFIAMVKTLTKTAVSKVI